MEIVFRHKDTARENPEEYVALKTVIKSNLDMDSRAYIEFVKEIRDKYFTNIPIEQLNKDKLKQTVDRELVAYTNQFITTQPDVARMQIKIMEGMKMSHLIDWEKLAKSIANAPKQTPEQRAKGEEFARKMKGISSKELQELRKKAEEKYGL